MECRITLEATGYKTKVGMYDPKSGRHVPLGSYQGAELDKVVRDLRIRMEREGHTVTFSSR